MVTEVVAHDRHIVLHVGSDDRVERYRQIASYLLTADEARELQHQLKRARIAYLRTQTHIGARGGT